MVTAHILFSLCSFGIERFSMQTHSINCSRSIFICVIVMHAACLLLHHHQMSILHCGRILFKIQSISVIKWFIHVTKHYFFSKSIRLFCWISLFNFWILFAWKTENSRDINGSIAMNMIHQLCIVFGRLIYCSLSIQMMNLIISRNWLDNPHENMKTLIRSVHFNLFLLMKIKS